MKKYKVRIGENNYSIEVESLEGGIARLKVNGRPYEVGVEKDTPVKRAQTKANAASDTVENLPQASPSASNCITSPLPGTILSITVKEGDKVRPGQKIAVLEAMKMENDILAEKDGTVTKVFVSKGDPVPEGGQIARID